MKRLMMAMMAAGLLLAGCSGSDKGPAEVKRIEVTGVETARAALVTLPERIEAAGTIRAATIGVVSSKATGAVTSIRVKEGDRVKKGQLLLTIDDSDISQRLAGAEAAAREAEAGLEAANKRLALAEATFGRYERLFEARAISGQEFDTVTLERDQARLGHRAMQEALNRARSGALEARAYRDFARVTAPFAGVITGKRIDEGSMAAPGAPLIVMEDDSSFVLETSLDGRLSGLMRPGAKLRAVVDGREYAATVTEVSPSVDPATRTSLVKASIKGEGLRTGLFARVLVDGPEKAFLAVPGSALVSKGQLTGVFVVDAKGVVSYRLVRAGRATGGMVEVLSGLAEGETVISKGAEQAADGALLAGPK